MNEAIEHSLQYPDGSRNRLSIFRTVANVDQVLLILPALGVRASYYKRLALAFAQQGIHTVTVDWRGHGHSNLRPSYEVDFGYQQLLDDTEHIIYELERHFPQSHKYLLGHSLGGQIGALFMARYPLLVETLFMVGACNVHFQNFGKDAWKLRWASRLIPPVSSVFGHYPGKTFGFASREARGVMTDWAHVVRTGYYQPQGSDFDYEAALARCTNPAHAIHIEEDWLSPRAAVESLMAKFAASPAHSITDLPRILPNGQEMNHFSWAKHPGEVLEWLRQRL